MLRHYMGSFSTLSFPHAASRFGVRNPTTFPHRTFTSESQPRAQGCYISDEKLGKDLRLPSFHYSCKGLLECTLSAIYFDGFDLFKTDGHASLPNYTNVFHA